MLRATINPAIVHVIPSAVIADQFKPAELPPPQSETVTIVVISRLAYRKGVDLLVASAPKICARFPHVRFLIGSWSLQPIRASLIPMTPGGDGPKLIELLQMREKHLLQDRIVLLGSVAHSDVRSVRIRSMTLLRN